MLSSGSAIGIGMSGSAMQAQQSSSSSGGGPFSSYGDRPQIGLDVEFGADPASGSFFQTDYKKHDDLKQMLDSNKDGLKLEAMKRIIGMIARGRDATDLFPAVVKNVVSKNIEVKKLVYVYLVRYAEEQQDLVLLSISTFQRALKDPNQLIRASALRVLSSIRVSMIVPIVMLAIRESASDMSPYVRKTAAHAIPKLYSLDPEQKDELTTVIEKLLSDRTTLVVGSAVMAFDEVCPERVDLIHKNYRKLCNLLVDVDEWGQVIIINMLTRYARTQFVNPNTDEAAEENTNNTIGAQKFYDDSESESDADSSADGKYYSKKKSTKKRKIRSPTKSSKSSSSSSYHVDLDHRLLLRQAKPLLQSRNASVVMAVAQLYHHVAPRNEVQIIAKALIRLLRCHKEIQSVVLTCIASMSTKRKSIFEPYMKSFFVRTSDPTHIKLLKLDILTNLATAASISVILREFQTYISSNDRPFVAATIQAIGRCAASIKEVTETCLSGLVHLLSNRDEYVVAESVVVIKKLLQTKAAEHFDIISQMAKLLDFITVPAARASILWLIGEYNDKVPKIAPDILRKMAKSFCDEEDVVKLQILNLGVKLYLTNALQTSLLCQYVFTMARYDDNYDVRDRARYLRQFVFPACGSSTILSKNAAKVFLAPKPAPALESKYRDRYHFQLGSLSHYLNMRATGYNDLPDFPAVAPDPSVRNIESLNDDVTSSSKTPQKNASFQALKSTSNEAGDKNNFFSESEKSSVYSDSDGSRSVDWESDSGSDSGSGSPSENSEKSGKKKSKEESIKSNNKAKNPTTTTNTDGKTEGDDSGSEDTASSSSTSDDSDDSASEISASSTDSKEEDGEKGDKSKSGQTNRNRPKKDVLEKKPKETTLNDVAKQPATPSKSNLDLLLDLDDIPPIGPVMTPSLGGFLTPGNLMMGIGLIPQNAANRIELVAPSFIEYKYKELLNKLSGHGLAVTYRFSRTPHLFSSSMVSIEMMFVNKSADEITAIQIGQQKTLPSGMNLNEFSPIPSIQPQQSATRVLGADFNDSSHAIELEIISNAGKSHATIKAPIGELIRSVQIREEYFKDERQKLRGMNEHQTRLIVKPEVIDITKMKQAIFECVNVAWIPASAGDEILYFVGQTMSSKSLVLISLELINGRGELVLTVNCEKMVIGSMILNEIRNALQAAFK